MIKRRVDAVDAVFVLACTILYILLFCSLRLTRSIREWIPQSKTFNIDVYCKLYKRPMLFYSLTWVRIMIVHANAPTLFHHHHHQFLILAIYIYVFNSFSWCWAVFCIQLNFNFCLNSVWLAVVVIKDAAVFIYVLLWFMLMNVNLLELLSRFDRC